MGGGREVETEANLISTAHSFHHLINRPAADCRKLCHLRPVHCQLLLSAGNDNENWFRLVDKFLQWNFVFILHNYTSAVFFLHTCNFWYLSWSTDKIDVS